MAVEPCNADPDSFGEGGERDCARVAALGRNRTHAVPGRAARHSQYAGRSQRGGRILGKQSRHPQAGHDYGTQGTAQQVGRCSGRCPPRWSRKGYSHAGHGPGAGGGRTYLMICGEAHFTGGVAKSCIAPACAEIARFDGRPTLTGEGVRDAEGTGVVTGGIPPTDHRTCSGRSPSGRVVARVRPGQSDARQLRRPSRVRRRQAPARQGRTESAAPGESPAQDGARHPGDGKGLVRQKERCGFSDRFEFVMRTRPTFPYARVPCPACLGRRRLRVEYPGTGCSIGEYMRAELVPSVLDSSKPESVVHHGDQGSLYAALAFGKRCREMGTVGNACDNALAESFLACVECELIECMPSGPAPKRAWPSSPGSRNGATALATFGAGLPSTDERGGETPRS